jgi:PqqD family protein of HPr-rel-A system
MTLPTYWRVPRDANLLWRRWPGEDEYVFYHGASGDTHRLSELAGMILEQALAGPVDTSELAYWLSEHGDEAPEDTLASVFDTLAQLDLLESADAAV